VLHLKYSKEGRAHVLTTARNRCASSEPW